MTKTAIVLLVLLLTLCLFACKKNANHELPKDSAPITELSDEQKAVNKINEVLTMLKSSSNSTGSEETLSVIGGEGISAFSITDITAPDGSIDPDNYFYFKDNVLFFSTAASEGTQKTTGIAKLSEFGIATVTTANGKTNASFLKITSAISGTILQDKDIFKILELGEKDIKKTDKADEYTLSADYLKRVAKELFGKKSEDSASVISDTSFIIDLSKFEQDNTISLKIENSKTKDTTTVTVVVNKTDGIFSKLEVEQKTSDQTVKIKTEILNYNAKTNSAEMSLSINVSGEGTNISANAEISAVTDNDGNLIEAEISAAADINEETEIKAKLSLDENAMRTAGKNALEADISIKAKDSAEQKYSVILKTENSDKSLYKLTFKSDIEGTVETHMATLCLKDTFPTPSISENEQLYLDRAQYILENYQECVDKAESLTSQLEKLIKNGKWGQEGLNYYTRDTAAGVVYYTEISVSTNSYTINTYFLPDCNDYPFAYCENIRSFTNVKPSVLSVAVSDMSKYINYIPDGYEAGNTQNFLTYSYVEKADVYILINGTNVSSAVYVTERPTQDMFEVPLHELVLGNEEHKLHDFEEKYTEDCHLVLECRECGFYYLSKEPVHYISEWHKNIENETVTWELGFCEICGYGEINLYNTNNCPVTVKLDKVDKDMVDVIRTHEELSDYTADFDRDMVITEIYYHYDTLAHRINTIIIDIPQISEYCDYNIIGVTGGMYPDYSTVAALVLPEGVEFIMNGVFKKDPYISVSLPDSLLYIGSGAFANCYYLEELTIPKNVKVINSLFSMPALKKLVVNAQYLKVFPELNLENLETLEINSKIDTFYLVTNSKITELVIPEGVKEVASTGLQNDTLQKIVLPSTVEKIGEKTFYFCVALKEVVLGSNVTEIGPYAFYNCCELVTIKVKDGDVIRGEDGKILLPDSVEKIGERAFSCCYKIKEVYIPEKVTEIPPRLFENCFELSKVVLHDNIVKIGDHAMGGEKLYCEIPASLKHVGNGVFSNCVLLTDDMIDFKKLTYIGDGAFSNCTGLKNLVLGENLTYVGKKAFRNCKFDTVIVDREYDDEYAFDFSVKEITYLKGIKGKIAFGTVTNIHTTQLDEESPYIKTVIRSYVQEINFAGSEEVFRAAGYKWNKDLKINFNVKFD